MRGELAVLEEMNNIVAIIPSRKRTMSRIPGRPDNIAGLRKSGGLLRLQFLQRLHQDTRYELKIIRYPLTSEPLINQLPKRGLESQISCLLPSALHFSRSKSSQIYFISMTSKTPAQKKQERDEAATVQRSLLRYPCLPGKLIPSNFILIISDS